MGALLASRNENRLFISGGELDYDYEAFSDRHAQDYIAEFSPHLSILTVGAINLEHGLMDYHPGEARISRIAYRTSSRVLLAADSSKFGKIGLVRTAAIEDVDILVTDEPLTAEFAKAFRQCEVVIAPSAAEPYGCCTRAKGWVI